MKRRDVLAWLPATLSSSLPLGAGVLAGCATPARPPEKKGVMLMNRIAPSSSELYIADLDGGNERKLLAADSRYDYNASVAPRGDWLVFTSERNGDGKSDLFRARRDGSGIEPLVVSASFDDAGAISPDGTQLAFVSSRNGYRTNVWVMDLKSGALRQLTGTAQVHGKEGKPDGYFRPTWSPDGQWLAFSSDRNTEWRGHDNGAGWEHTQELAIYAIRADGTGLRTVAAKPGWCLGSPSWSPDGLRIAYHEMTVESTWGARRPNYVGKTPSQIVSVNAASGDDRIEHTTGSDLKLSPQYLSATEIGYLIKYGPNEGLAYTSGRAPLKAKFLRSPSWTPDGKSVVYEKVAFQPNRELFKPLHSWDKDWDYRFMDVFPQMSRDGWLVYTDKQTGNSSIMVMRPSGADKRKVFESSGRGLDERLVKIGLAGAFQPSWSGDGQWITFGLGTWFFERDHAAAVLWRVKRDGSGAEALTDGSTNAGFPSYSADGKEIVFRVWGANEKGLRILNLETRKTRVLTTGLDNLPGWSPDGQRIVFTRKRAEDGNFDVYTIRPDGTDLYRCTDHESGDGHAVWTAENRIMWSGSMHGFRDEAALYEQTFQQYGQIYIMNADGSGKRILTDSKWEDSMPLYVPAALLK